MPKFARFDAMPLCRSEASTEPMQDSSIYTEGYQIFFDWKERQIWNQYPYQPLSANAVASLVWDAWEILSVEDRDYWQDKAYERATQQNAAAAATTRRGGPTMLDHSCSQRSFPRHHQHHPQQLQAAVANTTKNHLRPADRPVPAFEQEDKFEDDTMVQDSQYCMYDKDNDDSGSLLSQHLRDSASYDMLPEPGILMDARRMGRPLMPTGNEQQQPPLQVTNANPTRRDNRQQDFGMSPPAADDSCGDERKWEERVEERKEMSLGSFANSSMGDLNVDYLNEEAFQNLFEDIDRDPPMPMMMEAAAAAAAVAHRNPSTLSLSNDYSNSTPYAPLCHTTNNNNEADNSSWKTGVHDSSNAISLYNAIQLSSRRSTKDHQQQQQHHHQYHHRNAILAAENHASVSSLKSRPSKARASDGCDHNMFKAY